MAEINTALKIVKVELGERSYPIYIGQKILPQIGESLSSLDLGPKVLVITNPVVRNLYGEIVETSLKDAGFEIIVAEIPEGEEHKNLESAKFLYDIAFENRLDRHSTVLALGGGVIGDMAGFVAATYMRGVNFVQVPTTLLAQVDSSVGGKVAVNHPKGKNMIGAFYQPKMVYADIDTLTSLPEREFRAGMAEVIKYGVIWDEDFFVYLEKNHAEIKALSVEHIINVVERSCIIKADVVTKDEREESIRAILNYGHTFGHAYEALTGYSKFVHGEAVAIGMITAADVAVRMGFLTDIEKFRIEKLVTEFGLLSNFGDLDTQEIIASMQHDKKVESGKIRYVIPEKIGKVQIVKDIPREILIEALSNSRQNPVNNEPVNQEY